jgi:hypothetical protein
MPDFPPDAFIEAHGLPRPQWKVILSQMQKDWPRETKHEFWCAAQRQWLERLRTAMPDPYVVVESDHHLILTAFRGDAQWMLDFAEELHALVGGMLAGAISDDSFGKFAILVFQGEARYWQYIRYFAKDNRPRESAGICIFDGDTHIAMPGVSNFKHVLVHEMVHARLSHLPLPHWVHEGIAQHIDRLLNTRSRMLAEKFSRSEHYVWWKYHGIQQLWSGEIFTDRRSDRRHMGYALAEQLVNAMIKPDRVTFNAFLREAYKSDGGEFASRSYFGVGLGVWAQEVLGPGEWDPKPQQWDPVKVEQAY